MGLGRIYNKRNNILLSAGILFVAAGKMFTEYEKHVLDLEEKNGIGVSLIVTLIYEQHEIKIFNQF